MIKPIGMANVNFRADKQTIDKQTGEYVDPMMKWPLRGAAFTNEVGEALRPIIGGAANLTWVPALMYIGADVYDKYKNDQMEYSPDSKRCLKEAIFQGLASVCLPVFAVRFGQNIFSQFGKFDKDGVSLNSKEHVSKVAEQFIANGKMHAFDGQDDACVKEFLSQVSSSKDYSDKKQKVKVFRNENQEKLEKYAEKTIRDLIDLRKNLLNPTDAMKSNCWYSKYTKGLKGGQTPSVAVKSVLTDFQKGKMMKGNFVKTIGGFIALGSAMKPIDDCVENVLIGKYVGPQIDNFNTKNK